MGSYEQLMVEGSITMEDSAVISATHIQNNGQDVMPVGYIKKSLNKPNWWDTNKNLNTDQQNIIWVCACSMIIQNF